MARPKPKKGLSVSSAPIPIQFPQSCRQEILEILNLDGPEIPPGTQEKVLRHIEGVFTMYPALLVFLDDAPRPAAKLAEIVPLLRVVKQASTILEELSEAAMQDIGKARVRGIPQDDPRWSDLAKESNDSDIPRLYRIKEDLKDFIPQLEKARDYLKTRSSQHGKIKEAIRVLTAQLKHVFDSSFNVILQDTKWRELQWDLLQTVFKAYNELNVISEKFPTDRRTIKRLLGPANLSS